MAVNLDSIEAMIRRAGCGIELCFTPYRGGFKFALTSGVTLTADQYQALSDRFAARPPIDLVAQESSTRNRLRAHRRASDADESAR